MRGGAGATAPALSRVPDASGDPASPVTQNSPDRKKRVDKTGLLKGIPVPSRRSESAENPIKPGKWKLKARTLGWGLPVKAPVCGPTPHSDNPRRVACNAATRASVLTAVSR